MGNCAEDVENQFADGQGGVDLFLEAQEHDLAPTQHCDRGQQLRQRATKSIEAHHRQCVSPDRASASRSVRPGRLMLFLDMTSMKVLIDPASVKRMVWPATSWSPVLTRA